MATDFSQMSVPQLRQYLQKRLVSSSKYNRRKLVELAKYAEELNIEVLDEEDYSDLCEERRQIILKNGEVGYIIDVTEVKDWSSDLKELPDINTADIMIYLLSTCQWSETRLRSFREDKGYKLYQAGHIFDVKIYDTQLNYMYICGRCVPQTRQTSDPYLTWVLVDYSGYIKSGGCTCVADDGSCKHVVGLLFACNSFCNRHLDRHTLVGTDETCLWDKPKKECKPSQIDEIQYYTQKNDIKHTFIPVSQNLEHAPKRDLEIQVYNLCRGTSAGFLHMVNPPDTSDESEEENNTESIESIIKENLKDKENILDIICQKHDDEYIHFVAESTVGQNQNPRWFDHRKYRITASQAHKVVNCNLDNLSADHYLVKEFLGTNITFHTAATNFGSQMEIVARNQYFENFKQSHEKPKIESCGLLISKENPFMGASPDGIIKCRCCGTRLLEIKCTYKYQDKTPLEIANLNTYHIHLFEGSIKLKTNSSWYYQIQMQLGVAKKEKCDFVLFTRKGVYVETIKFDKDCYLTIVDKCKRFFEVVINRFIN